MTRNTSARFGIAVVLALLLHLAAATWIHLPKHRQSKIVAVQPITFFRLKHVPQPTNPPRLAPAKIPRPRQKRKPHIVMHARSRTVQGSRAREVHHAHTAAKSAHKQRVQRELSLPKAVLAPPLARLPATGTQVQGAGKTSGIASSSGTGSGGQGGAAASGAGVGVGGSGSGDGVSPCGTIYITRRGPIKTVNGIERVHVGIQLQLRNGTLTPEVALPYPLLYRSDAESPFSAQNRKNSNFPTLLQFPPDDIDQSTFPEVIKIALAHTTSSGYTDFGSCPADMNSTGPP